MRWRVDELAAKAEMSVDTVRFYQSKGLLDPPERDGRVGWYSEGHLDRLHRIRSLKDQGFSLSSISKLLGGGLDAADAALVAAVLEQTSRGDRPDSLTLEDLASMTGVSPALLEAVVREGLLRPRDDGRFTKADARVVGAGLQLLESGLPLSELLALARRHDEFAREIASTAVDLFVRFVRDGVMASATSDEDAATKLIQAFDRMLDASTSLIAEHFRSVLLEEARARAEVEL